MRRGAVTVIVIGVINVLAHRWGPEITQNGFGLFVVLAGWTWLRAVKSLRGSVFLFENSTTTGFRW